MVFQKKVVKIENLTVSDRNGRKKELKSAADVMSLKSFPELEGFIMAVFGRIIAESRLTEDEEKNSESATSASGRESSEEN